MYERNCYLFEEGLNAIAAGILKKGGTKKHDKENERIGRLKHRFSTLWRIKTFHPDMTKTKRKYLLNGRKRQANRKKPNPSRVHISCKQALTETTKKIFGNFIML
jgi:hypothetical protein